MLTLSIELLTRMHAHLEAGYPHEACGILIGDITFAGAGDLAMPDGHGDATPRQTPIRYRRAPTLASKIVKDLVLVPNVWSIENERESQRNRFLISPDDVARADRAAGKRGMDIVGFFHSHPDCPPRPSETDREFALPVVAFVIVSVLNGKAAETASWVLRDDRSGFDAEEVQYAA